MKKTGLWLFIILAAAASVAASGTAAAVCPAAASFPPSGGSSLPATAAVSIKVVEDPATLPPALSGIALKGDYLVTNGKYTAVIAASPRAALSTINYGNLEASGFVLAFYPEGASQRIAAQIGVPSVRLAGRALRAGAASVKPEGARIAVRIPYEGEDGLKLDVTTRYGFAFDSGRLNVSAEIRNSGASEAVRLSFGLGANAFQNFNFSPYHAKAFPRLNFRVWQRPDHVLGWHNPNPPDTADDPLPGRLRPGQVHGVAYTLVAGAEPVDVLNRLYALAGVRPDTASLAFEKFEGLTEVLVREPVTGAVFFRTFMDRPAPLDLPLLPGTYTVRAHGFPAVVEKTLAVGGRFDEPSLNLAPPEMGRVRVSIADRKGRPVLGKVSFIGLAPTPSPYFAPENPVATGRGWEGFKNSVYPSGDGIEVLVPAGTYLAASSRGPEYTRESRVVEILAGDNPALEFRLDKVVDTRGLVSIDSHMHTQYSDGAMRIPERLRSVIAEGLDVAVATDHNYVTDYGPDLSQMGLTDVLAVIVGNEVTARTGSIHYNTFPNAFRPSEPKNGAISVDDETPDTLFALSRSKDPEALIHVNHPRSRGLGYFLTYDLDEKTAAEAKAPFSMDFDVMEAMNGAALNEPNRKSIEDWFHFLNRGYAVRAVGVSDSHGIDGGEPGYARTYVLYDGPKGAALDQAAVVRAMKEGRSFFSTGPIVSVRAGRGTLGDTVPVKKNRLELHIRVTGAPWLDVSEVRLVVNGERSDPLPIEGADGKTVKFKDMVRLELERDAWIAVEVRGRNSIYPVVQQRSGSGAAEQAVLPYALTNPVFADVDGNGRYDPIRPEKVAVKSKAIGRDLRLVPGPMDGREPARPARREELSGSLFSAWRNL